MVHQYEGAAQFRTRFALQARVHFLEGIEKLAPEDRLAPFGVGAPQGTEFVEVAGGDQFVQLVGVFLQVDFLVGGRVSGLGIVKGSGRQAREEAAPLEQARQALVGPVEVQVTQAGSEGILQSYEVVDDQNVYQVAEVEAPHEGSVIGVLSVVVLVKFPHGTPQVAVAGQAAQ